MAQPISFYFPAGDFIEAFSRFHEGQPQTYATHDELVRLMIALRDRGHPVKMITFASAGNRSQTVEQGIDAVELGAIRYDDPCVADYFRRDDAALSVLHFPHLGLLDAGRSSDVRCFPVLASSYNRRGPRSLLQRRRLRQLLNDRAFRWVSNHCNPATRHLAALGVDPSKLIAWDIPHQISPDDFTVKAAPPGDTIRLVYAGSLSEAKGVGDLVRAVAISTRQGLAVECEVAGGGAIDEFKSLADGLGIAHLVHFKGLVSNDQVLTMFRDAHAIVVPSRPAFPEGFPLTLFEAIATRTPIICSDHPMFGPVLKDRETALVFKAGNPESMAGTFPALADKDLYQTLSANAERSWAALQGPADWRTMLFDWATLGNDAPYLHRHAIGAPPA